MAKKYRFFYHYYRQYNCMSVHFRGVCYRTKNVVCDSPTETKWNKKQPQLTLRGWAKEIIVKEKEDTIIIK
jgi:hypothetical protein